MYSSKTGTWWTFKKLRSSYPLQSDSVNRSLNFNGMFMCGIRDMMMLLALGSLFLMTFILEKTMISVGSCLSLSRITSTLGDAWLLQVEMLSKYCIKDWRFGSWRVTTTLMENGGSWQVRKSTWALSALMSIVFLWELTRLTLIWSIYGEGHKSLLFIRNRRLGVMVKVVGA